MSCAALRLIQSRRLCTTLTSEVKKVFQWRTITRKLAKVAGAVVLGGCLFITYEVTALDKAVTIDTSVLTKEKYKSYIYLKGVSSEEKDNFAAELTQKARKELHKAARRFLEISSWFFQHSLDEHFRHVDADPHEVALWVLLKKAKSANKAVRLQAVQQLGENHNWHDYQYQTAAQVIDQRTAVGLARTPQVDIRFFRPPPALLNPQEDVSAEDGLRQLLGSLPQSEVDKCVQYFTSLALRESTQSLAAQRGGLWCFGGNGLPYAQSLTSVPSEKVESFCLQALVQHSKVQSHCDPIVKNGGLHLLQKVFQLRKDSLKIQRNIVRIIGNLAINESLHQAIVQSGWVSVLAEMMQSPHIMQASMQPARLQTWIGKRLWRNIKMEYIFSTLKHAAKDPNMQDLLKNTKGILFYSVPHRGTFMAEYSVNVRYLLFPSIEVKELCRDSPALHNLNEGFLDVAKEKDIKVLSFAETLPTNIGPMIKILVVSKQSADLGIGELIEVDVDHLNICKPEKKNSFLYRRSLQFIQESLHKYINP
ncbi:hypothetical protein WMY93_016375 [Mugilogobius chulae]|uniref:Protein SERAC1 n=1 Tax=Mugilogobius chulae TaxID=88201 RepID=A0AAW0P513_9GOBI